MVKPVPCPSCNGLGCASCSYIGFFGRDDQTGREYFLSKDASGNIVVSGLKSGGGGTSIFGKFFGFIFSLAGRAIEEPHDFIWETKYKKT